MKTKVCLILSMVIAVPLISSCAHEEVTPVEIHGTVQGIHINAPEFLKLTSDDIKKMERALKKQDRQVLSLSEGQKADCQNQICHLDGKNLEGDFATADLKKFSTTLKKAQSSGKEEKLRDGPVTLRCVPTKCAADLMVDDDKPHEFSTTANAKVSTDYSGFLLGSFIGGMMSARAR